MVFHQRPPRRRKEASTAGVVLPEAWLVRRLGADAGKDWLCNDEGLAEVHRRNRCVVHGEYALLPWEKAEDGGGDEVVLDNSEGLRRHC